MNNRITAALLERDIDQWGVCRFIDCLPLLECRAQNRIPHGACSVIVCLFPYDIDAKPRNVARYAVVQDYHLVARETLAALIASLQAVFPDAGFAAFADSSPLREVSAAALAGLGIVGAHGQLINPKYGTKVFIGAVVTTLELPPSPPNTATCLHCGRCFSACPTGALRPGHPLEQSLCRSWISQKKGQLSAWETEQLREGGLVWGCDHCTDACPMNPSLLSPVQAFWQHPMPILNKQNLDEAMQDRAYAWRGRAVLLRNLAILDQHND